MSPVDSNMQPPPPPPPPQEPLQSGETTAVGEGETTLTPRRLVRRSMRLMRLSMPNLEAQLDLPEFFGSVNEPLQPDPPPPHPPHSPSVLTTPSTRQESLSADRPTPYSRDASSSSPKNTAVDSAVPPAVRATTPADVGPQISRKAARNAKRRQDCLQRHRDKDSVTAIPSSITDHRKPNGRTHSASNSHPKLSYALDMPNSVIIDAPEDPRLCPAALIVDGEGRRITWRGFGDWRSQWLNELICGAVEQLEKETTCHVQHDGGNRGQGYRWRIVGPHKRSRVYPAPSAFTTTYPGPVKTFTDTIQPVTNLLWSIYKAQFPDPFAFSMAVMEFIIRDSQERGAPIETNFGPFSTICINSGCTATIEHQDDKDWPGGMCGIIAAGRFNCRKAAHLCITIGDTTYIFVLPPGIPIFIPSAVFKHGNVRLEGIKREMRHSLVFFLDYGLVHYYNLNGRSMSRMSKAEVNAYLASLKGRWADWVDALPVEPGYGTV